MSLEHSAPDPFAAPVDLASTVVGRPDGVEAYALDEPEAVGPGLLARAGAELFGTFVLVFAGAGTLLYSPYSDVGGSLAVAGAFGIAAAVAMATVGRVSGGHFNPAITLAAAISGRLSWADLLPYWLVQLVGGAFGAAVLFVTIPDGLGVLFGSKHDVMGFAANGFGPHSPLAQLLAGKGVAGDVTFSLAAALLVEVAATGILVATFLAATRRADTEPRAPFVVGLALAVLVLVAMPVTNASLNPARSTAIAILSPSWALSQLWLFWVAPLLGAGLAALLYRAFVSPGPLADDLDAADDDVRDGRDADDDGPDEPETVPILPA